MRNRKSQGSNQENNAEPEWRLVERVAALLEQALIPTAKVEHNIWLPVLGTRRKRQCDVVITFGDIPRQTIAIVEVQKRNRKPNINTFHGWVQKMREVGAQHLICVSVLGYPRSIVDEVAQRLGPTIRLMTLTQLEQQIIGDILNLSPVLTHRQPTISIVGRPVVRLETKNEASHSEVIAFNAIAKNFYLGNNEEKLGLFELINRHLAETTDHLAEDNIRGPITYTFDLAQAFAEEGLWLLNKDKSYPVAEFTLTINIEYKIHEIKADILAYEQEFIDGVVAWIYAASGLIDGEAISVRLVFRADADGFLQLTSIQWQGISNATIRFYKLSDEDQFEQNF